ncbi:MAG TPA: CHASE2 domain-containing protein, partial [Bacteroidota bacterium]|nr:CHASE2 domain-containing protein [Bacteroidota bacterium]
MASYSFKKQVLPLLIKAAIGLGLGILVALIRVWAPSFVESVDHLTTDYRYQARYERQKAAADWWNPKEQASVVIIGIGEGDSKAMPVAFPYPRWYYAHLIENLEHAGARAIALDITFDEARDSASDATLDAVLSKYDNVILGAKIDESTGGGMYNISTIERSYGNVFYKPGRRVGITSIAGKDRDDVVRRYLPMMTVGNFLTPTFGFAALNITFGFPDTAVADIESGSIVLGSRSIPMIDGRSFLLNYYGPDHSFRYIDFLNVIDDSTFKTKDEITYETDINNFDESQQNLVKGKIVLVGSTMPEERDYHQTPIANNEGSHTMNGVEIHATAIQNILDQNYIRRADPTVELSLILFLALVSFLVILRVRQIKVRYVVLLEVASVVIVAAFIFAVFEIGIRSFMNSNLLLNIVYPSLAVVFAYLGAAVYQYLAERQQKALIKNVFSKYISAAVVNELVANPEKAKLGGDRREL